MLRTTPITNLAIIFISILLYNNSNAQTIIESINIKWEPQARQTAITEDHTLHYLYFENASYDESQPQIPIFSKQFKNYKKSAYQHTSTLAHQKKTFFFSKTHQHFALSLRFIVAASR